MFGSRRLHFGTGTALVIALVAACGGRGPTTPTPTCSFTLSLASAQVPAAGQAITVHVETAASCAWTVRSAPSWIAPNAASGAGPADVVLTVAANDGTTERSATITIADKDVAVRQAGRAIVPCTFSLQSSSSTFGSDGGRGRVSVVTGAGCAWTAAAQAAWISLRVASGTGPGEIEYDVAAFDGSQQRETRIVVADASFAVRQDPPALGPCTYAVDPTSARLHWHGAVGDGFDVRLTTASHCSWTAVSGALWIELLTAGSGSGPATMRTRVAAYTAETTRSGPLMIRWPTPTAGQNVVITQEGCRYAVSITADAVTAAGGRRRVGVFGTPASVDCSIGCPWTVVSNSPWIHVPGVASRAGDDDVFFDVDANTTGAERFGSLTIAGFTVAVTQAR